MNASPSLEAFIDESIRVSREHGYHPSAFVGMRHRYETIGAIKRLVISGEIQSGFKRMQELGLLNWTIEEAVRRFPDEFPKEVREAAEWRLSQAQGK